jgi:hypothetical protein
MSLTTFISFTTLFLTFAIFYLWKKSRELNYIDPHVVLSLGNDNNGLARKWIDMNIKYEFDFNIGSSFTTGSKLLSRITNKEIKYPVLMGNNIYEKYSEISGITLDRYEHFSNNDIDIYNIRNLIGIDGDIAVVKNNTFYEKLIRKIDYFDDTEIKDLIYSDLDIILYNSTQNNLKYRWDIITKYLDNDLINRYGSYAYLKTSSIPNTTLKKTSKGYRLNMLCSSLEFDTLVSRLKVHIKSYERFEFFRTDF